MAQDSFKPAGSSSSERALHLDVSVAHPARVYDFWLGGKDNFAADREAAQQVIAANPEVLPGVRANRAFLGRVVRHLTGEAGIRQFLDIGTGLPTVDNTHEVAQQVAADSRVVYVDNDPIVLAHARALLTSTPEGATAYVDADLRDTATVLDGAARTLDFGQPVAVMLLMILQYVPDSDDPWGIVKRLVDAVPSGSYLVVSDTAADIDAEIVAESARRYNQRLGSVRQTRRTKDEFTEFFTGLELGEPGVVPLPEWRALAKPEHHIRAYAAVGRKP
ncbi:MAG: SAM-dependent methyltransferase [Streptosporangiaceae bacterium]